MSFTWHIWVIKENRFDEIAKVLDGLSEVDRYVYPTKVKEYKTKKGIIKKRTALYSGYLFIRYRDSDSVFHKLNVLPYFTTYVGTCTGSDLERVEEVERLETWNVISKSVCVDDVVKVNSGPFKDFMGVVIEVSSNGVIAMIEVFGRKTPARFSKDDVDVTKRA